MNVVAGSVWSLWSLQRTNSTAELYYWAHGLSVSIRAKAILCGCKEKERGDSKTTTLNNNSFFSSL